MRHVTIHEVAVRALREHDGQVQIDGFTATIRRLIKAAAAQSAADMPEPERAEHLKFETQDLTELWRRSNIRPDAFKLELLEGDMPVMTIYEVEDSSEITVQKMLRIVDLWWFFDAIEGDLKLFVLDRYGQNQREISVRSWECTYHRALKDRPAEPLT